jgi:dihydroorotase-like cyclic amidohydrolase
MSSTVIHSVNLFDGWAFHQNSTVVFDSDSSLITAVGPTTGAIATPQHATIIDGSGHTLLPGFIEAHMHSYNIHLPDGVSNDHILETPLQCGITTLCDMHSDPPCVERLRAQIRDDLELARKQGPQSQIRKSDLKSSLFGATISGGWPKPIVLGHNPSDKVSLSFHQLRT